MSTEKAPPKSSPVSGSSSSLHDFDNGKLINVMIQLTYIVVCCVFWVLERYHHHTLNMSIGAEFSCSASSSVCFSLSCMFCVYGVVFSYMFSSLQTTLILIHISCILDHDCFSDMWRASRPGLSRLGEWQLSPSICLLLLSWCFYFYLLHLSAHS